MVGEGGTWKKNSHKSLIQIFLKCLGRPDRKGEKKNPCVKIRIKILDREICLSRVWIKVGETEFRTQVQYFRSIDHLCSPETGGRGVCHMGHRFFQYHGSFEHCRSSFQAFWCQGASAQFIRDIYHMRKSFICTTLIFFGRLLSYAHTSTHLRLLTVSRYSQRTGIFPKMFEIMVNRCYWL